MQPGVKPIPESIISKPPSAELNLIKWIVSLPDYEILDNILKNLIEEKVDGIAKTRVTIELIEKIILLVEKSNSREYNQPRH